MQRFALQSETRILLRDLVRVCARLVELDEAGSNRGINSH
jgi:hypothetical protein